MNDSASKIYKNLKDVLLEKGLIDQSKYDEINLRQLKTGEGEEEVIDALRIVSEIDFVKAKAAFLRVPFVDLETIGFSPEALTLVPESVAQKYKIVPYNLDTKNKTLWITMVNPLDLETIEFLEKKTNLKVNVAISLEKQISSYLKEKYIREKNITSEVTRALDERKDEEKTMKMADEKVAVEAPVAKIVTTILEYAVKSRASDVHIEPQEDNVRIRYRIDGILQEKYLLPRNVNDAVVSRIKILSNLKIDEKRVPQDGRFFFSSDGNDVDLRVSTLPTTYGEKVVMRLLKKSQKVPT
ncbi:MAG: ATPase, T2SS/T4P/T4SS family, partial [Candidatus Shapirobacteria bacterium]|nr:ATPase, T2SS/T4P/T4SS family [Candidatus Shapirobacteria bacterium]